MSFVMGFTPRPLGLIPSYNATSFWLRKANELSAMPVELCYPSAACELADAAYKASCASVTCLGHLQSRRRLPSLPGRRPQGKHEETLAYEELGTSGRKANRVTAAGEPLIQTGHAED